MDVVHPHGTRPLAAHAEVNAARALRVFQGHYRDAEFLPFRSQIHGGRPANPGLPPEERQRTDRLAVHVDHRRATIRLDCCFQGKSRGAHEEAPN